jgi:hypothetical protein
LPLAAPLCNWFNPPVETVPPAWEKLLDGRFDSKHPGRTLWKLFSDQRGRVVGAITLYIIKQSPASLLPLAVGMIVDTLTKGGEGAFRRILVIAACYFLLLLQKGPFFPAGNIAICDSAWCRFGQLNEATHPKRIQKLLYMWHFHLELTLPAFVGTLSRPFDA